MTRLSVGLIVLGLAILVYVGASLLWMEPATSLYTTYEQHHLRTELKHDTVTVKVHGLTVHKTTKVIVKTGHPLGVIRIPRLGLDMVWVQGTDHDSLTLGPGHYPQTHFPGQGKTIAIAGHRTTYLAPFRHIDQLRKGDPIYLTYDGKTFTYYVSGTKIVANNDWSIIFPERGYERLVLTACHPLFSASHRIAVFALPRQ